MGQQGAARQREVAQGVQHLVAHRFIGMAQAAGAGDTVTVEDHRVLAGHPAKRQPLLTLLAWSMLVGVFLNAGYALATQGPPQFDTRPAYGLGILYLGLLGSVVTFPLYYGLVRKVGAGTAAYSSVIVPIVAMILSTLFEGFVWGPLPAAGAAITLIGMVVALRGRSAPPPRRATPEP